MSKDTGKGEMVLGVTDDTKERQEGRKHDKHRHLHQLVGSAADIEMERQSILRRHRHH